MDVHRSRFVPYPTSAITALAFSRSSDSGFQSTPPALRLALGRANGNVELWNPLNGLWVQETVFPGDGKSVDGLAWTQEPDERDAEGNVVIGQLRLFSIASSPAITEWNLPTGRPKRKSTGNFSEVWCFAAQPRWKPQKNLQEDARPSELLAGCGDGTMVLLSTADDDLQFKRFLARVSGKKARCMCVTYQNRDVAVAGFADSNIRIYDTRNGSLLRNMSLGAGIPGAPKDALVWQVKCLPSGDVVSADSNGEVRFWDGRTYSLLQRIKGHDSDCLDLTTSQDGKAVFSGSIDGRVAVYRQSSNESRRSIWSRMSHRRVHHGEVKAMAAFDSKGLSVVVSGGVDIAPIATPLREFGRENTRALSSLPQEPPITSAPKARLLISWWNRNIYIWRIAKRGAELLPEPDKPKRLVAKINIDTDETLRSVAVSEDGRLLAASTTSDLKVFQLRKRIGSDALAVRRVAVPESIDDVGARVIEFSPNGKWLALVTPDNEVHVARIVSDTLRPKHLQLVTRTVELEARIRKAQQKTGLAEYDQVISRMAFASDSSVLAAADLSGHIHSWVLEGHEDFTAAACETAEAAHDPRKSSSAAGSDSDSDSGSSSDDEGTTLYHGQHWTDNPSGQLLPKLDSAPLVLTFRPTSTNRTGGSANGNPGVHATRHNPHAHSHELPHGQHRLFVMTAAHRMYEMDVLAGKLSDWSRRNPTAVLPEDFTKIRDRVVGAVWDVNSERARLWLYGSNWMFMLNVGQDLGEGEQQTTTRKRRRRSKGAEADAEARKRWKANSGAGGDADGAANGNSTQIDLPRDQDDVVGGGEDGSTALQLARIRNGSEHVEIGKASENAESRWWHTFKYRPILGMVALQDEVPADAQAPLEVVVVERPFERGEGW